MPASLAGRTETLHVSLRSQSDAETFALRLLDEEKVAVLPTHTFGPSGAGHVRISLGMDDDTLVEAARRIRRFADAL